MSYITHLLPLPYDVTNYINGFLFYTKKDGELIKMIRNKKKEICDLFYTHHLYQKYTMFEYRKDFYYWIFFLSKIQDTNNIEGYSCSRCGNYLYESYTRIICAC